MRTSKPFFFQPAKAAFNLTKPLKGVVTTSLFCQNRHYNGAKIQKNNTLNLLWAGSYRNDYE